MCGVALMSITMPLCSLRYGLGYWKYLQGKWSLPTPGTHTRWYASREADSSCSRILTGLLSAADREKNSRSMNSHCKKVARSSSILTGSPRPITVRGKCSGQTGFYGKGLVAFKGKFLKACDIYDISPWLEFKHLLGKLYAVIASRRRIAAAAVLDSYDDIVIFGKGLYSDRPSQAADPVINGIFHNRLQRERGTSNSVVSNS